MRHALRGVASAAILLWIWPGQAADSLGKESGNLGKETGARLLARCEPALEFLVEDSAASLSRDRYAEAMSCLGFVEGFLWGHGWAAWRERRDMYYCPPEAASAQEAVPVLVAYLHAHPERQDAPAHVLLFAALSNAWPCLPMPQQ